MTIEDILRAQDKHSKVSPTTKREWADWWFKAGELHGRYAVWMGSGRGSATDCYFKAQMRYADLGDHKRAAVAKKCSEGCARLIGSGR